MARWAGVALVLATLAVVAGCSAPYYRKQADKEVYRILEQKQGRTLGRTNNISIDTAYSHREPREIKPEELIIQRLESADWTLTLEEALRLAAAQNRQYQNRREALYLSALTLTGERYRFKPQFFVNNTATAAERFTDGEVRGRVTSRAGVGQLFKSGGSLSLNLVNDVLRFYTGDPDQTVISTVSVNLVQPLLRGAGAEIAAERLTQAERNVVYEIRVFDRFQHTFAVDVVASYFRLLQRQDTVRNEYSNYRSLVLFRERQEALAKDRLAEFEVSRASQNELAARSRYIVAVERYQADLDQFKITLGLPLGTSLRLDDRELDTLRELGLIPVTVSEIQGFETAVENRLDLLNDIDRFEDRKRRIKVTANSLKTDLNIFARASHSTDYTNFDIDQWSGAAGIELNLPIDRLSERNLYRNSLIDFELQLRNLTLALDNVRDDVNEGLRSLSLTRQNYAIQRSASELADRQVESAQLLLDAGRREPRDLLEARDAQVRARNAVTQVLVDYHLARLRLLHDLGRLDTGIERFWLKDHPFSKKEEGPERPMLDDVIEPERVFGTP